MRRRFPLAALIVTLWVGTLPAEEQIPKGEFIAKDLPCDLVFMKRNQSSSAIHFNTRFEPGGNLFVLKRNGTLHNLTHLKEGAVSDPDVSYDGKKILFSMMKDKADYWHVYEINADGSGLRQITSGSHDNVDACYLPNGRICFCSNRTGIINEYEMQPTELLHVMDADGSNVRQISFILSDDFNPVVLNDGRILWCRYEHHGRVDKFPLMVTNPDGSDTFEFFGVETRIQVYYEPTQLPDGRIVCTATRHFYTWESGALVLIDPAIGPKRQAWRPKKGDRPKQPRVVTSGVPTGHEASEDGRYKTPFAMPDGSLLVSWAPGPVIALRGNSLRRIKDPEKRKRMEQMAKERPDFGIWRMVWDESEQNLVRDRLLYNDPKMSDLDPMPLAPRKKPPVIPSRYRPGTKQGHFLCLDVYNNTLAKRALGWGDPPIKRGDIKAVRVIEGLPIVAQTNTYRRIAHYHHEPKRILGEAPVYEDGSFYVKVPTEMPVHFQTLDKDGRALTTQLSWVFLIPGEDKLCIGCHEDRAHSPVNADPLASLHPPTVLDTPPEKREMYHFVRDIYPILQRNCVKCHSGAMPAGEVDFSDDASPTYNVCYETLRYLFRPGSTRKSAITRMLSGKMKMGQRDAPKLSDEEFERLCKWIELGGLFRYGGDGQVQNPLRRKDVEKKINPILQRRGCLSPACHGPGYGGAQWAANLAASYSVGGGPIVPIEVGTNITHPSRSRLLLAPREKNPNGLKPDRRDAARKLFEQNCAGCHRANKSYSCRRSGAADWAKCIEKMCGKKSKKKRMQIRMSPEETKLLSTWLAEFAGRGYRPICPNVWRGSEDPDVKTILAFLEETSQRFIGIRDVEKAEASRCSSNRCHPRGKWESALKMDKSPEWWKKTIMRMVQKRWWGIRPAEAAIIYHDLLKKAGKARPLPPIAQGETAETLLAKSRALRFQGKIAEAATLCRQALSLNPTGDLDRRVRIELGVLFTQYGTPALTEETLQSRLPKSLRY